jgi:hypothetical protein
LDCELDLDLDLEVLGPEEEPEKGARAAPRVGLRAIFRRATRAAVYESTCSSDPIDSMNVDI